jgi:predicted metal-dependent phosphoesterase TrpH
MRIDLHCHTCYSSDSLNSFDALLRRMDQRGLDMVALTDHNTTAGALEFHAQAPDRFVVGEEIKTFQGEILALFVEETVPAGLSIQAAISRVRGQGGLVGVSHPLDRVRGEGVGLQTLEAIRDQLDFIEVFNARMTFQADNQRARELANRWGLPASAGSDAHAPFEVGRAYVDLPRFEGSQDFLDCLAQGQIGGRLSSPLVHLVSTYAKWRNRFGAR